MDGDLDGTSRLRISLESSLCPTAAHLISSHYLLPCVSLVADDVPKDFAVAWRQIVINEDLINSQTKEFDPRHWLGVTNHDIFRWPAMINGTQKQALGHYVGFLMVSRVWRFPIRFCCRATDLVLLIVPLDPRNAPSLLRRGAGHVHVR